MLRQCQSTLEDLEFLLPWLALAELPQWLQHIPGLGAVPALRDLVALDAALEHAVEQHFARNGAEPPTPQETHLLAELRPLVLLATVRARERVALIQQLSQQAAVMADADYGFLYDKARHLIAVGYNVDEQRRDTGYYDLLASEARLCSFVAIAQGEVPQENWFALGRLLTGNDGRPLLLSWSGSMFEYLMPMLVMPTYANTLLDQTCRTVVERQIAYGGQCDLPWGMSESGYNTVDAALNYQYRAFGVPGLGLKRGLTDDLVVAPYASALALMVMPDAACQNLERLVGLGLQGAYGMFEAIDFTPARVPRGQTSAVVRSFMAHHQGMSLSWPMSCWTNRCKSGLSPIPCSRLRCCCCRSAFPMRRFCMSAFPTSAIRVQEVLARKCPCACCAIRIPSYPKYNCSPMVATTSWSARPVVATVAGRIWPLRAGRKTPHVTTGAHFSICAM